MSAEMVESISPAEFAKLNQTQGCRLIDVRTPAEYASVRVASAENVPLSDLDPTKVAKNRDEVLYVICKAGRRGEAAAKKFKEAGYNVKNVAGGVQAWAEAGLPVTESAGSGMLGLEQQTQLTIGSLIVLTSLLVLVHPYFFVLPLMMGSGLVFAGLTGSCAMAMLLARMPWNRSQRNDQQHESVKSCHASNSGGTPHSCGTTVGR